jgi:hypothetical protein
VPKPLKLIAEGGDQKVKSVKVCPTLAGWTAGFFIDSDDVTIDGFEIAYTHSGICADEGSFLKLSNNYIHHMSVMGIYLNDLHGSADYNLITSNVFDNIEYSPIQVQSQRPNSVVVGIMIVKNEIRNSGHGINLTHAENCAIVHNVLEYIKDWAIHLSSIEEGVSTQNNLIAHNSIKHVIGGWGAGISIDDSVEKTNIHHNYIEDVQPDETGWPKGMGIYMRGSYNLVHQNIVVNVFFPYRDFGMGNKVFKNSWQ